uniref:Uncharacterized protein n=1 Tax=Bombyx mori TaxID=7091 RepID=A0A8R2QX42_BOMMO|nr:facilitated trehalose transporter Tret1-like isoform X3 [Bombyx mori]
MMALDTEVAGDGATYAHYVYKKDFRTALPQFLAVSVKNLLLLGYGMTLGFTTILIPAVEKPKEGEVLYLEKSEISWISSINLIVVPLGCAVSGIVTTPIGRRRSMQVVNLPFFIAWLLFHFSTSTGHLYAALFLTGLAGGLLEAPILAVIALCFVPESPHWLVAKKRYEDARKSLQWLRGWTGPHVVEQELQDIKALFKRGKDVDNTEETLSEKVYQYCRRSFLLPFFLVSFSFFVGHFSGMTTLQTYAVSIFQMLEAPIDKYYATLILGILQILGSGACVLLVHYTGKRPLAFFSTGVAGICCILVAIYDLYARTHIMSGVSLNAERVVTDVNATLTSETEVFVKNPYSWMPTTFLMVLALATHTGIRLLPWILIGEVFNAKTRSGGAGLASAVGYIFGFLTNKMYISMVDTLSIWGTYGFYGIVSLMGCTVLYFILPETEGKKLNEIENHFTGIRKLTNQVYRSKRRPQNEVSKMQEMKGATNPTFENDTLNI